VQFDHITTDEQLAEFCGIMSRSKTITFDTEFVSEDSYRPELCLLQVEADGTLAVIDPYPIADLTPFWNVLADGEHATIVHSGREEYLFCLRSIGRCPRHWFDVQIAAGMVGLEYPASYANLVSRLIGKTIPKGETRTDWRRRPLTSRQLNYALQDVVFLDAMSARLNARLEELGRRQWLDLETRQWQQRLESAEQQERWRRLSGISGLSRRGLSIARQLWRWREAEACRVNQPPRRLLRDDLIVELARRGSADVQHIRAIRGLSRGDLRKKLPAISQHIQEALDLDEEQLPRLHRKNSSTHVGLVTQFLVTALSSICRAEEIAPGLVGTVQDVRDFVEYRNAGGAAKNHEPPALAQSWRLNLVGQKLDDLLAGRVGMRIRDPRSETPLAFEE
jgi:ribonuclease D